MKTFFRLGIALAIITSMMVGSAIVATAAVTGPYTVEGNVCPDDSDALLPVDFYFDLFSGKIDMEDITDEETPTWEITAPDGYLIVAYCVKAGSAQQGDGPELYLVDPPVASLTISHSSGKDISHFSVYYVEDSDNGQWCSPGYWRQSQHLDSWDATGISPDALYSAYFGAPSRSKKGVADGAPTDPTLWQVLQSPQWYGGEAFNNVGDLLSAAHPDVEFDGERVEDSCPLN